MLMQHHSLTSTHVMVIAQVLQIPAIFSACARGDSLLLETILARDQAELKRCALNVRHLLCTA